MWGALLGVTLTGWLHQLTATPTPGGALAGHGVREGQAMIATLRHRLIRIPARLVHHAGTLTLRLPPGYELLDEVSPASAHSPQRPDQAHPGPERTRNHATRGDARALEMPKTRTEAPQDHPTTAEIIFLAIADSV